MQWLVAVLAVAAVAMTAHQALMASGPGDHLGNVAALCMVIGAGVAVIGVAAFALRRPSSRPLRMLPALPLPAFAPASASPAFPARAGPAPPRLQIFLF